MAYDFLKKLFKKDENGAIIPMTAEELEAAIDEDKNSRSFIRWLHRKG